MALNSTHPLYDAFLVDWITLRDCYAGERVVKEKGEKYLPATASQKLDGMGLTNGSNLKDGQVAYDAYKMRAVFHDFVSEAVESYIGLLHQKPATFELPEVMKTLEEKATTQGEGLLALLRRINEQQLVCGRVGLLLDLPAVPDPAQPMPYISVYIATAVRNWDDSDDHEGMNKLGFVSLDESTYERGADYVWKLCERYRICELLPDQPFVAQEGLTEEQNEALRQAIPKTYKTGVFEGRSNTLDQSQMVAPMLRGKTLDKVPFVIINTKDTLSQPDKPPLLGLASLTLAVYRGEADYRQSLYMQGQDTLVVIGGIKADASEDGTTRVGAGAKIEVDVGGDAKYIGVASTGLAEMRSALENDKKQAMSKSGQMIAPGGSNKESGEALKTRLAAQTATLNSIALSGASGLETLLRIGAEWMGQDPEKVVVTPNLEFADQLVDGKSIVDLMSARTMGAPLSLESIHEVIVSKGLSRKSYEEEMDLIAEEDAGAADRNAELGLDPTGQVIPDPALDPNNPDPSKQKAPANA